MIFTWDDEKAIANIKNHKVSFEEAVVAFTDPNRVDIYDADHSTIEEARYNMIGRLPAGKLLFVVYTESQDGETIHLISAR